MCDPALLLSPDRSDRDRQKCDQQGSLSDLVGRTPPQPSLNLPRLVIRRNWLRLPEEQAIDLGQIIAKHGGADWRMALRLASVLLLGSNPAFPINAASIQQAAPSA